jgi:hypothetical protein
MTKVVGDKILMTRDAIDLRNGRTYTVCAVSSNGDGYAVTDDRGEENWALYPDNHTAVETDELAELQAWKAKALARFPALEDDETDFEAAERFAERAYSIGVADMLIEAFKWARENNC